MLGKFSIKFLLVFLLASSDVWARSKQVLLPYEPAPTTISGILQTRTYPGPPNYTSIKHGDEAETIWLLRLPTPVTVKDNKDPTSDNETETSVREIQLVILNPKDEAKLEKMVGNKIKLTGTLFHAFTGHHHLKVLMDVKEYRMF